MSRQLINQYAAGVDRLIQFGVKANGWRWCFWCGVEGDISLYGLLTGAIIRALIHNPSRPPLILRRGGARHPLLS
jgi:hypothetical protein